MTFDIVIDHKWSLSTSCDVQLVPCKPKSANILKSKNFLKSKRWWSNEESKVVVASSSSLRTLLSSFPVTAAAQLFFSSCLTPPLLSQLFYSKGKKIRGDFFFPFLFYSFTEPLSIIKALLWSPASQTLHKWPAPLACSSTLITAFHTELSLGSKILPKITNCTDSMELHANMSH